MNDNSKDFMLFDFLEQVVLYMSTAISIVQNPKQQQEDEVEEDDVSKSSPKNISWYIGFIRKGGNNFYYAITSFAKGEVTSESDGTSYQI